jgi:hypothetical protein
MGMGIEKERYSTRYLILLCLGGSVTGSVLFTGLCAGFWVVENHEFPLEFYRELASIACLAFWGMLIPMSVVLWRVKSLGEIPHLPANTASPSQKYLSTDKR